MLKELGKNKNVRESMILLIKYTYRGILQINKDRNYKKLSNGKSWNQGSTATFVHNGISS